MKEPVAIQRPSAAEPDASVPRHNALRNAQQRHMRTLVEVLMASDSAQRPALARQLGLPKHAVSDLLAGLETRGMIQVAGALGGLPGRSQFSYALRADAALALGFDVGGTKVAAALCDMRGAILAERTEPTDHSGADGLVAQMSTMADRLCADAGQPRFRVRNIAVGVPSAVDPLSGMLSLAGNLPGLEGVPFSARIAAALGGEVHLDNDVNLALIAEVTHGCAKGRSNVAFIALGTGIGGALLINGHLLRGAFGGAGEIGYMPLWRLEAAGSPALEDRVGEAGIRQGYVAAGGNPTYSVRDIFEAAAAGDGAANLVLDQVAEAVARGLVGLLSLVDPDIVVFGGSIGSRDEFIARVQAHVAHSWMRPVTVQRSEAGGRAGLLGAIELARQQVLEDLFGPLPPARSRR